ncbi:hypothetical protein LCGC14_2562540 [marine sediment metagenome]|uniref:Uncharacterized protein n=1 Tax=marine sediment metagenome TaxID=412755 RepID=A0A0F9CVX2_9ZZZZ
MDLTTILELFASPIGLSGLTIVISEFVDKYWDLDGAAAFLRAAVVAAILCLIGMVANLGYMADVVGFGIVKNIVEVILLSAGAFNIPFLKELLEKVKLRTDSNS